MNGRSSAEKMPSRAMAYGYSRPGEPWMNERASAETAMATVTPEGRAAARDPCYDIRGDMF